MHVPQKGIAESSAGQNGIPWSRAVVIVVVASVAVVSVYAANFPAAKVSEDSGAGSDPPDASKVASSKPRTFAVNIRRPAGPPRVPTGRKDAHGNSLTVACSTCHSTRPPNRNNKAVSDLREFHRGMTVLHGTVSCLSCHNSDDYDALKLADGSRVEFSDVMTLCGQCHGPQLTDYQHGAHGGMNGHWDLTRGPQMKNNCVDCHNPHAPQFPRMQPTFKPIDRFLSKPGTEH